MNVAHFEGVSGAAYVSIIAFSIVFAVLFGLTVMIFAMKLFAGSKESGGSSSSGAPAPKQPAPAAVSAAAAPVLNAASSVSSQGKVIAAITAAVLAASGGGRIMSITPAAVSAAGETGWTRAWKANGVADLIARRARTDRGWKH